MLKKGILIAGTLLLGAGALGGLLLYSRDVVLELDGAQLQGALAAGFPVEKTYLGLIQVNLTDPVITLKDHSDRIHFGVSAGVGLPGLTARLRGSAELSGRARYDPSRGAFYAEGVQVEALRIGGLPDRHVEKTRGAVAWMVQGVLEGRPLYTLRSGDARHSLAKLLLKDVRVEQGKLRLTLGVAKAPEAP